MAFDGCVVTFNRAKRHLCCWSHYITPLCCARCNTNRQGQSTSLLHSSPILYVTVPMYCKLSISVLNDDSSECDIIEALRVKGQLAFTVEKAYALKVRYVM